MEKHLRSVLTALLICLMAAPVFAYSAWQPAENFSDDLPVLVLELRTTYEKAVANRAASTDFLKDLESIISRFEALSTLAGSDLARQITYRTWSEPVEIKHLSRNVGAASNVGQIVYLWVKGANNGRIWGTNFYTNDSDLGTAAVHAGVLDVDENGIVAVRILPAQSEHVGSTRNGITSLNYGTYNYSYEFVEFDKSSLLIQNPGNLWNFAGYIGQTLAIQVTGSNVGTVWGTGVYTLDSDLATAAVHSGLVKPGEVAVVLAEILPGQDAYTGSENFGVSSRNYGTYRTSYRLKNPQ